jgi:AraC family transcriptional regulator of adaptative response / DNA-3-methyladenine glycosylase II
MQAIAAAAGFGSVRRFNDTFLKTYGRPPRALRRGRTMLRDGAPLSVRLPYRAPYDWHHLLAFHAGRATPGVERVSDGRYLRTVSVAGKVGSIDVHDVGGSLSLTVRGLAIDDLFGVVHRVRGMFDIDAPIDDITARLAQDRTLRGLLRRNSGVRVPGAWDGWELCVRAVLGQQVSVKAATTFAGRIAARYGEPCELEEMPDARLFPTPQQLVRARLEKLGIIRARAQTIRDLARAAAGGSISFDASQDVNEFCTALRSIRGIGEWTAQYVAMRALKDPDAFPASDLGLLRAFDGDGGRLKPAELLARAERWRPWRAYAALLIWSSDDGAGG